MKIANQNITISYWCANYYVLLNNGAFQKVKDSTLIVKNCGHQSKRERMSMGIPVNWDVALINEELGHPKIHDWYSFAIKGSTDSFVNQFLTENRTL